MTSGYEDEVDLLNVSFQSLLRVGIGKLPDTYDAVNVKDKLPFDGLSKTLHDMLENQC